VESLANSPTVQLAYDGPTNSGVGLDQVDEKRPYRRCAGSHDPEPVMIKAVVPIKAD
jgi:hypothetical protein